MTNEQHVTNLIKWHRFVTDLLDREQNRMESFISIRDYLSYINLREYTLLNEKLNWITQEQYNAEHDLISAAITYQVPHIKMLQDGHVEDFYTLLIAKARDIDEKEVLLIRKN